ncbi:general secretion pathway protein B [Methylobacter tundripaludum]|uniref:General secretion pathway protein B n=1 Tax=Methylobacter tundripaludum TaxID=173365 RepID=A0A2S6H9V4_9GAMM|nr:general secretion pathway protein GspB [Methylobacter tundripaludum]PPK74269.1 general secretion pathway protein B [Methylobacter tundripaludum]
MSFILNALRKSEQERQARQAENVTDKILLPQSPQSSGKTTKLLVFLLIANVLVIAGSVWFVRNNLMSTPDTRAPTISPTLSAQDAKLESKEIAKSTQSKRPAQKAESEITSIAELIDKEKPEPAPLPVTTKKTAADTIKQPAMTNNSELQIQTTPVIAPAANVESDEHETIPARKGIPLLSDLPFEFRQALPKFTINVFVYSQDPEERFIMIDMVKYKPGQQIKDAMLLKEILPDGFVIDYQNRVFKIKRP